MDVRTEEYSAHKWIKGEVISEANLNNIEHGLKNSNDAIRAFEIATVQVETLEAGEQASGRYDVASNTWFFSVPKGDQGKQGQQGPKGDTGEQGLQGPAGVAGPKGDKGDTGATGQTGAKGEKGDQGARGNCIRIASSAVNASQANNPISNLTPTNSDIPLTINDLVIDSTKKVYKVTAVSGSNFTASAVIATLP